MTTDGIVFPFLAAIDIAFVDVDSFVFIFAAAVPATVFGVAIVTVAGFGVVVGFVVVGLGWNDNLPFGAEGVTVTMFEEAGV